MVEKRIRVGNPRRHTPPGLTLAEKIIWKRRQMREEQSYREEDRTPDDTPTDLDNAEEVKDLTAIIGPINNTLKTPFCG